MEREDFQSQNNDNFKRTLTKLDISIDKLRKSSSGSKRNGQIRQIMRKMIQDLFLRKNLIGTKF